MHDMTVQIQINRAVGIVNSELVGEGNLGTGSRHVTTTVRMLVGEYRGS